MTILEEYKKLKAELVEVERKKGRWQKIQRECSRRLDPLNWVESNISQRIKELEQQVIKTNFGENKTMTNLVDEEAFKVAMGRVLAEDNRDLKFFAEAYEQAKRDKVTGKTLVSKGSDLDYPFNYRTGNTTAEINGNNYYGSFTESGDTICFTGKRQQKLVTSLPIASTTGVSYSFYSDEQQIELERIQNAGVKDKDLVAPPALPQIGDAYIVANMAKGDWAGKEGQIAYYRNAWKFIQPREGLLIWVDDENKIYFYHQGQWVKYTAYLEQQENKPLPALPDEFFTSEIRHSDSSDTAVLMARFNQLIDCVAALYEERNKGNI